MPEETDNLLLTMQYLGHKDMRTTKKYAKVGSTALTAGVEKARSAPRRGEEGR